MFERLKSFFRLQSSNSEEEILAPVPPSGPPLDPALDEELQAMLDAELEAQMAEEEAQKVLEPAEKLPEGFTWCHWGDGSGGLYKDGKEYASYDVNPAGYIEYMVLGGRWELSELHVTLMEVQDDIEKRVLDHLNIQQQETETLETEAAEPEPEEDCEPEM